jgi:cardiolipin synthase
MWSSEKIYIDSDIFFQDLLKAIECSTQLIELEMYIFKLDSLGHKVLTALSNAAKRDVEVKLLLDGVGCSDWNFQIAEGWRVQGIQIKFFHELPWQKKSQQIIGLLKLHKLIKGLFKLNHRNHRKICIIDDKYLFLGSSNISTNHLKSKMGKSAWRDTSLMLEGDELKSHSEAFKQSWEFSRKYYGPWWRSTRRQKQDRFSSVLQQINSAKNKIWITNPYFIPDIKLIHSLRKASKRGVEVKILLPDHSDVPCMKWAMRTLYGIFLRYEIEIYEYRPSVLHAKILIIDDWISVGSSNLDHRSIFYNLEADAILTLPSSILEIKNQFLLDLQESNPIKLVVWKKNNIFSYFKMKFTLFLRKWL